MHGAPKSEERLGTKADSATETQAGAVPTSHAEMPEDVAALFRSIDLKGVVYRDFAAVHRESRARQRYEAARLQLEAETSAADEANRAAIEADRGAQQAAEAARQQAAEVRRAVERHLPEEAQAAEQARLHFLARTEDLRQQAAHERMRYIQHAEARRRAERETQAAELEVAGAYRAAVLPAERSAYVEEGTSSPLPDPEQEGQGIRLEGRPRRREKLATPESRDQPESAASSMPSWMEMYAAATKEVQRPRVSGETLQTTRTRIAERWYALRGIVGASMPEPDGAPSRPRDTVPPLLALFSMAGGVGKTSLAASLTRALAAQGERVLLVDMTSHEILPFFFGAEETRPGGRRVFAPPPGTPDAPIHLVDYAPGAIDVEEFREKLHRDSKGFSRVVLDTSTAATTDLQHLIGLGGCVLIPLLPDMNSLLTLRALRRAFPLDSPSSLSEAHPWYLLTQFDSSQPLHLDIREMLEGELGEQLLPFVMRHSPAIAEALAQGMTVMDYAPSEGIAADLQHLAAWLRTQVEPAREGLEQARWSER